MGALLPIVLVADPVMIGTESPTCSWAVWLFSTCSLGAETTLMWVRFSRAFKVAEIDLPA